MEFPKKGPIPKRIIYKHVSDKSKKCLSVRKSEILSVLAPAYTSLCRGLENLLKVRYIILVDPNVVGFLKVISQKWEALCLVPHIISKLTQNVYLINTHILIYWHARCDCTLWNAIWFYCVFWVFSYIIDDLSCLNCFISTKLALVVYLINTHILICWQAKWYKWWKVL